MLEVFDSQISGGKRYDLAALGRRRANATFFQSHAIDEADSVVFAMDLSPLVQSDTLSLADFVEEKLSLFKSDVSRRAAKYGM